MRRARGQATVELALGAVVFVAVLLVGIHFAEVAWLSLKVQEAQAFATWEATHRRVQTRELSGATTEAPFTATLDDTSGVEADARRRYRDFNGLTSSQGSPVITQALTQGRGLDVECHEEGRLTFEATRTAQILYYDVGGVACTSRATINAIRIPEAFLQKDEGGFFRAKLFKNQPLLACGMGLPVGAACEGSLAVLTNDWGFVGDETKECKLDCRSSAYRGAVNTIFAGGGWTKGREFAEAFAGPVPAGGDATAFHFSFSGVESSHVQYVLPEPGGEEKFLTGGPGVSDGMVPRNTTGVKCFLGVPGCQ